MECFQNVDNTTVGVAHLPQDLCDLCEMVCMVEPLAQELKASTWLTTWLN